MNYKKRYMDTMLFKDTKNVPFHEIALWQQTLERWKNEGLPDDATNGDFFEGNTYFGFEPREFVKINSNAPVPLVEYKVLEEDERTIIYTDRNGVTHKAMKEGTVKGMRMSMDQYIDFPVKDRDSFKQWKKRFEIDLEARYPDNWETLKKRWNAADCPVCLLANGQFGFYSMLRTWMGTEGVSYIFYDDPDLVHEMLDFLADYIIGLTEKALKEVPVDYFNFFEDMSFKNGPLVSPEIFRKFFLPRYKRVVEHLRRFGIKLIIVDTDGNPMKLMPLFIEAGINGLWPIEVAAGIDPIIVRKEFGKDLALVGGIDKRILGGTKEDIREEVLRILDYMLPIGGYIPTIDHAVSPEASLENFMYYLDLKKRALEGKPV